MTTFGDAAELAVAYCGFALRTISLDELLKILRLKSDHEWLNPVKRIRRNFFSTVVKTVHGADQSITVDLVVQFGDNSWLGQNHCRLSTLRN